MIQKTKTYEGMFLVEAGNANFEVASEPVKTVLQRAGANLKAIKPWEERRLCYEIAGRKRALYVLTYFELDPEQVKELERDAQLNDGILRALILRKDKLTEEELNAETPAMTGRRTDREEEDSDSDRDDRRGRREERRPRRRREEEEDTSDDDSDDDSDADSDDSDDSEDSDE